MQKNHFRIDDSINAIEGLKCWGIKDGKNGLGIVVCDGKVAGVFTTNKIKAAPIIFTQKNIKKGIIRGLVVNSGNANAYTGEEGLKNTEKMAHFLASKLNCDKTEIAVCSTGIIGKQLDMGLIEKQIEEVYEKLESSREAALNFARSIMTTDSFPKEYAVKAGDCVIAGVAKGAGMISPSMQATMLAFIFTDAYFEPEELQEMISRVADMSFNVATVDGDTSTNDTLLIISTGKKRVERGVFERALFEVCFELSKMIVRDGEGATKVFEIHVMDAKSDEDAFKAAKTVANSLLVKTAIFGSDPNWGRIIAALGYSGVELTDRITLWFERDDERVYLLKEGVQTGLENEAARFLRDVDDFRICVSLHCGTGRGYAIGCDLTYDYVKLNAEYTT
jgi:glutamate N-acetyltransferase/amino-acid N-acetyltransferase